MTTSTLAVGSIVEKCGMGHEESARASDNLRERIDQLFARYPRLAAWDHGKGLGFWLAVLTGKKAFANDHELTDAELDNGPCAAGCTQPGIDRFIAQILDEVEDPVDSQILLLACGALTDTMNRDRFVAHVYPAVARLAPPVSTPLADGIAPVRR